MSKTDKQILKLAHSLYDQQSILAATAEFSQLAEMALMKYPTYTEVSFLNTQEDDLPFEFANYALFLTIQSR